MQDSCRIQVSQPGSVGLLLLDRSDKANAYDELMLVQVESAIDAFLSNASVRAIIIGAEGTRHFCAGADLGEIRDRNPLSILSLRSSSLFSRIARSPKPVIAAVNGAAVGGGFELALACDLRLASPHARFSLPETGFGLIPAAGATMRLPQVVGPGVAREIILLGREIDAARAKTMGLVNEVVEPDRLIPTALEWGEAMAARDPLALRLALQALDVACEREEGLAMERVSQALLQHIKQTGGRS